MKKIVHSKLGFTIIETLIAMLVFSVGLLGVMSMQLMAIRGNTFGSNTTRANTLCVEMIERILNNAAAINGYDNLDTRGGGGPMGGIALNDYRDWSSRILAELGPSGYGTVLVAKDYVGTPPSGQAEPGANTVSVEVAYGIFPNDRHVRMSTVISYP